MKSKNLILTLFAFFSLILTLNLVNAVDANFNVYYAVIENDGSLSTTSVPVTNLDAIGYTCSNSACTQIGSQVAGLTASTSTSTITVSFPVQLQSQYGYVLYFYKGGYIGWELPGVIQYGSGAVLQGPNVYLTKKQTGFAPIMNLDVDNEVQPNMPVEINTNVAIDADTYSAIEDAHITGIQLQETVETLVTLEITDNHGDIVYADSQSLNIPYSSSVPVSFSYSGFSNTGSYEVTIYTDVTDEKIINSIRQSATEDIFVIEQGLTDYYYTLISHLEMDPVAPEQGDTVDFSFDYLSNYVESDGSLTPVDTRIELTIYRGGDDIYRRIYHLDSSSASYQFPYTFDEEGSYRVVVEGEPDSHSGYSSTQEITFLIGQGNGDDDDDDDEDKDDFEFLTDTYPLVGSTSGITDLTPDELSATARLKKICWTLFWIILVLLVLIAIVSYIKFA